MALEKIFAAFVGSAALFSSGFLKGAHDSPIANPQPASAPEPADQVEGEDLKPCLWFCQRNALFLPDDSHLSYEKCFDFCVGDLEFAMGDRVQLVVTPGEVESVGTVLTVVKIKGMLRFSVMLDWGDYPLPFESRYLEKLENPAPKHECEPKPEAEPEAFKVKIELPFDLYCLLAGALLVLLKIPNRAS